MKNIIISLLAISTLVLGYFFYSNSSNVQDVGDLVCKSPIATYEDPTRMPLRNFILDEMGDLSGKTIGDIGAGPGFFSFEMARTAEKVVATELDPTFLRHMTEKKEILEYDNFEVVEAREDHTELKNLDLDYALMVFVFHYIENPTLFLDHLKSGLNEDGEVFIANAQMSPVIIQDYLRQAGFIEIDVSHFSFTQPGGCGDMEVQLIRAEMPAGHVQL